MDMMMNKRNGTGWSFCLGLGFLLLAEFAAGQPIALEDIGFVTLPDSRVEIALGFNSAPPSPEVFMIENPARLTLDFADVINSLQERRYTLDMGGAESLVVLEAQGRTRLVLNLDAPTPYEMRAQGSSLILVVGEQAIAAPVSVAAAAAPAAAGTASFVAPPSAPSDIAGLDFRRGENGAGRIIVDLANSGLEGSVARNGANLELRFRNAQIPDDQQMRLDVTDFATPVQSVSMFKENGNVMVRAQIAGQYEYQTLLDNGQYIINVVPVVAAVSAAGASTPNFSGERISLNLQEVEVGRVLQILADFNDFSLVVGDNVTGNVTLRLDNVPWDQALDIVLRSRGLGQRLVGTVLYVAPATVIDEAERMALETSQQLEALAPLVTEYIQINYAVAADILAILQGRPQAGQAGALGGAGGAAGAAAGALGVGGAAQMRSILSERGRASVDIRTNTLIVQDIEGILNEVRALVARLDIPVRQVLIEARIVNASTSFSQALGIRWGGAQTFPRAGDSFILGGSMGSTIEFGNNIVNYNQAVAAAIASGTDPALAFASNTLAGPSFPEALAVDLGVVDPTSSIALGYAGNSGLLQLELSALESSGNGEVIAQPKVTTQDKQLARIESGVQIPYQSQAGGTAGGTTTEFVTAALSLEVTPQITPDGRIIMLLDIHQDAVVPGTGTVPAISTNSVNTRVLVNNGDTVVLGGVFREEVTTTVSKTPVLGDLPYVGNLFKRKEESESKTELLIFITPTIINDVF